MTTTFNADTFLAALEAPTLTLNGTTYTAKALSFRQAVRFQHTLSKTDLADPDALEAFVHEFCKATNLPADEILDLPPQVFNEVLTSFFTSLLGVTNE